MTPKDLQVALAAIEERARQGTTDLVEARIRSLLIYAAATDDRLGRSIHRRLLELFPLSAIREEEYSIGSKLQAAAELKRMGGEVPASLIRQELNAYFRILRRCRG